MLLDSSQTSLFPEVIGGCCTEADCKSAPNPEELSQFATVKQHPIPCVPLRIQNVMVLHHCNAYLVWDS